MGPRELEQRELANVRNSCRELAQRMSPKIACPGPPIFPASGDRFSTRPSMKAGDFRMSGASTKYFSLLAG